MNKYCIYTTFRSDFRASKEKSCKYAGFFWYLPTYLGISFEKDVKMQEFRLIYHLYGKRCIIAGISADVGERLA
ncbi:hypothetical protein PACILC2_03910 [Paenibacillus cisolokensis]|uniref:Uncharacterized protein n=1 Tax=Paenibacillus cisolokensis TaxID=1658519 RepID=A0ABQ4N0W2_9BACL|nr:hypothetical protein PACILC2_03910 [Paenibacillus cisolokensis]